MRNSPNARAAGSAAPQKGEGQHAANVLALREQLPGIDPDSAGAKDIEQAPRRRWISGHSWTPDLAAGEAISYLMRAASGPARPGDLLQVLTELDGPRRRGAAPLFERVLERRHG